MKTRYSITQDQRWIEIACLICICVLSSTITCWKIATIPLLQQPDELAHYDYVSALYEHNGLYKTKETQISTHATMEATYLKDKLEYSKLRYNEDNRPTDDYRTEGYRNEINSQAPDLQENKNKTTIDKIPYAALTYPVTYYLLGYEIEKIRNTIFGEKILENAYSIRYLGVPLLIITILSIYINLNLITKTSVVPFILTATCALFPSTTEIFSYIQPDVLTTALVSIATTLTVIIVKKTNNIYTQIAVYSICGILTTVKFHYGILLFATTLITLVTISIIDRRKYIASTIIGIGLQVTATVWDKTTEITTAITPYVPVSQDPHAGYSLIATINDALQNIYLGGNAFSSYWYTNGIWLSSTYLPKYLIDGFTIAIFSMTIGTVICVTTITLKEIQKESTIRRKVRKIFENPNVTIYVCWTVFLIAADVVLRNELGLLGRYWAPVEGGIVGLSPLYATGVLKKDYRTKASVIVSVGWLCLSSSLCYLDLHKTYQQYALPAAQQKVHSNKFLVIEKITLENDHKETNINSLTAQVDNKSKIQISGWGLDDKNGEPASKAFLLIDKNSYPIHYHLPTSEYIKRRLSDDDLSHIGFAGETPAIYFARGTHTLRFYLVNNREQMNFWAGTVSLEAK